MIDTHLDFSGMLDLDKELELLSKAESRTVLRQAVRAGAAVIKTEAQNRAPERTGKLKRNIIIANGKGSATEATAGIRVRGQILQAPIATTPKKRSTGTIHSIGAFLSLARQSSPPFLLSAQHLTLKPTPLHRLRLTVQYRLLTRY